MDVEVDTEPDWRVGVTVVVTVDVAVRNGCPDRWTVGAGEAGPTPWEGRGVTSPCTLA